LLKLTLFRHPFVYLAAQTNFMTTSSSFTKLAGIAVALTATFAVIPKSQAATITVLDFEGIADNTNTAVSINNFYNGGTSSNGKSGTNYGVTFSSNALALALNTQSQQVSNTSRGGQGSSTSQLGGFFYQDGTEAFLNFAAGFDTGFSFFYSAPFTPAKINVYSGTGGAGSLLATLDLPTTVNGTTACPGFGANYCPFVASGVGFTGIAQSIGFVGTDQSVFDDITFGSVTAGGGGTTAVPEPFTIVGTMIGGAAALRIRKRLKATNKL
jgi:hypothetical protein